MCNPIAAAAIGLGGSILQGIGAAEQRNQNARTNDLNADGVQRDIGAEREATAYTIARTREGLARKQGMTRAGFSANGLALSGSAAEVIRESAIEGDLDVAAIQWSSNEKIKGMEFQRDTLRYNAGHERAAAPLAFITPIIGGAAKFGGSFG
jgi:hypothetical protein